MSTFELVALCEEDSTNSKLKSHFIFSPQLPQKFPEHKVPHLLQYLFPLICSFTVSTFGASVLEKA